MVDRHPGLAPNRHIKFGCFPNPRMLEGRTRDQNNIEANYLEKPSRFSSQEADRMANYLPPGSAGRTSNKEAVNDINLRVMRDAQHQYNTGGGHGVEAVSSDPSFKAVGSGAFTSFTGDDARPSAGALNELNSRYAKARTSDERDALERDWASYLRGARDDGGARWKPRQPAVSVSQAPKRDDTHDAPWSGLYEANSGGRGAGLSDPNKLQIGQELSMPGGGTHTVAKGETLSGIASSTSGGDLGGRSLASERGGVEPTGGNYSAGGSLKVSEPDTQGMGGMKGGPTTLLGGGGTTSSSSGSGDVPTPPVKPSEYGGAGGNNETGMGGAGKGPTTLLGGGGEASGGNYSSNASLKTGEGWPAGSSSAYPTGGAPSGGSGEGLKPLASEGGSGGTTNDAKKPRGRRK